MNSTLKDIYDYTLATSFEKAVHQVEQKLIKYQKSNSFLKTNSKNKYRIEIETDLGTVFLDIYNRAPLSCNTTGLLNFYSFLC